MVEIRLELKGIQQHPRLRLDVSGQAAPAFDITVKRVGLFFDEFWSAVCRKPYDLEKTLTGADCTSQRPYPQCTVITQHQIFHCINLPPTLPPQLCVFGEGYVFVNRVQQRS
jgi:hypothetical protein